MEAPTSIATPATLPAALRDAARLHGDRPAVVDGDRNLTFGQLLTWVRETARAYAALGVGPGDRVCVWAPNTWHWVVAGLAVSYAGATLVPVNSRYTAHEVADVVMRTRARVVVVSDGFLDRTQVADLLEVGLEAGTTVLRIATGGRAASASERVETTTVVDWADLPALATEIPEADIERRADEVRTDDVADILFTSGTTGRSKGAMSAHRQTLGVAAAWAEIGGVDADDQYLVVNPFFHSFGYKIGIVVGLLTGATIYPMSVFDADEAMRLIQRHEITVFPGAPTLYQSLLNADRSDVRIDSLRLAITGAAVVPVVLVERMRKDLGIDNVYTAFGMTEAVVATMCREGDPDELVANTCGRAIPGMETRIANQGSNAALPAGTEGELLLRGDYVMLGYLDDEQATAKAIDAEGWLRTGDVGRLDEAGNLTVTDRLKDMYISGGFNVYPAEVEQALTRLDGVADCAVVGVPDERLGEVGKAYVVRAEGVSPTEDDVVGFARERLANFKVPRQVEFIDVLPRNLSGKVLKTELRKQVLDRGR